MGVATVAVPLRNKLWMGSFHGDRVVSYDIDLEGDVEVMIDVSIALVRLLVFMSLLRRYEPIILVWMRRACILAIQVFDLRSVPKERRRLIL